jgi:predicted metal-binding membrane protein
MAGSALQSAVKLAAMPMEGHWQRVNTPLRRLTVRERNVVLAGLAVTVVALLALLLATAGDSQPGPAPGCIRVAVAGRVGGELIHPCGAEAKAVCARSTAFDTPRSRAIAAECRDRGIKF